MEAPAAAVEVVTVEAMGTITTHAAITIPVATPMGMKTCGLIVATVKTDCFISYRVADV